MNPTATTDGQIWTFQGAVTGEPQALWPGAPRLAPTQPFPPYRYVPGINAHPVRDKAGHSFGAQSPARTPINAENWRDSAPYLFGIDLYHNGYLWEAHESWEELWNIAEDDSLEANFLQALILNSAAQLKAHLRNPAGVRSHSQAARWRLSRIHSRGYSSPTNRFLGIDVNDLIAQIRRHYGPVWASKDTDIVHLNGVAPRLVPDLG